MRKPALALLVLGLLRMAGDAFGCLPLAGLGAAMAASPAPKVFTRVGAMEPFSRRFVLAWDDAEVPLTPELYARLDGPYNRRNAYGAVLAAAPALEANPLTRPMCRSVLEHALAGEAPLLAELGLGPVPAGTPIRILYLPPVGSDDTGTAAEVVEVQR